MTPPTPVVVACLYQWDHPSEASGYIPLLRPSFIAPRDHVEQLLYAGVEAVWATWHGRDESAHDGFLRLLEAARGTPLKVAPHYELDIDINGRADAFADDLRYLSGLSVGWADVWLMARRVAEPVTRPVIALYRTWPAVVDPVKLALQADTADRWHMVTQGPGADSRYIYDTARRWNWLAGECLSVTPGSIYGVPRDLAAWKSVIGWLRLAKASKAARWLIVQTWDERPEATGIEPAKEWGFDFIAPLRQR